MLTFRENVAMLRTSRDEALTDALTGLGNRRALARELDGAAARRPTTHARSCSCSSTSTASSTTTTPSATRRATPCWRGWARTWRPICSGRGRAFRMGGDEFCALFEPGDEVADPIIAGAATALTEHGEGFNVELLLRRDRAPARGAGRRPRRCGSPTSACTRRRTRGRDVGDAPDQGRAACAR